MAGTAKSDITDYAAGPVNDPSYSKALVLRSGAATAVLITVDAVAIGEIGRIPNTFMDTVRSRLRAELGIAPESVIVNASHCHSIIRTDTDALTVETVKQALRQLTPVRAGAGRGTETRIMENRRLRMNDGSEVDLRRAYSMPRDEDAAATGPVDPEIGLLRLDRLDGSPFSVLYNFAAHPIMGVPSGGNTADYPGFASRVIEENLGGAMAFFVQGAGGDINPVRYKGVLQPNDAEPLGNLLGLSVMRGVREIRTRAAAPLKIIRETLALPRAADIERRIMAAEAERIRLVDSLAPTNINFKTFVTLLVQHRLSPEFPSYYSQGYLHDRAAGRDPLVKLDAVNKTELERYARNIDAMERITRIQTNLALLRRHLARVVEAKSAPLQVDVVGLRVGDFRMITFPGELTVEIGLNIKKRRAADSFTFVAGYTNGYIYYTPTAAQRNNTGFAQEDCDSMVAPEWQAAFEERALSILGRL
ncbi:MAG: hypothetical protein FJW39_26970 [Acidobacteria bacterium]|nr:hypothetical protein [Acidobacteriota bacterium]